MQSTVSGFTIVSMMKNKLRDRVLFGLIMQLQDGQILNYMSEMPVDELVHMASIMREMYVATDEIRFRKFGEAALQHLNHLGITLVEDIL